MNTPLNILLVEDSADDAELLLTALRQAGFAPQCHRVQTESDFLAELQKAPEIIISDYSMPQFSGLRALELLKKSGLNIPFLLISGTVGEEVAVEAMRMGAADYFLKDRIARLGSAVERALEQRRLRTERLQSEASLNLFRTLIDRSNDAIEVIDPATGRFLDVNATACRRLGYKREELLALRVTDIEATAVDVSTWLQHVNSIRDAGSRILQGRHKRKDGSTFPVEVNVRHVQLDREYLIASARDITERRQADKELRESQALYHSLVDQMAAGIFRKDRAGRFVLANPWFCEFHGVSPEELIGRTMEEILGANHEPAGLISAEKLQLFNDSKSHHEQILQTGRPIEVEEIHHAANGTARYLHVVKSPVFDSEGQVIGSQGVQFDITESKRAGMALNLFRTLIDRSSDGIDVIDPESGRFLDVNETTCQRLGYTRKEMLGMVVPDISLLANTPSAWSEIAAEIRQARCKIYESGQRRKDGSTFPVEVNMRLVTLDREYLVASVRDITERRKTEEVLRASEERLRLVTDNAQVGLVMVDARRHFTFANGTYAKTIGLPLSEIVGRHVPEVVGRIYEEQIRVHLDEAFAGRRVAFELHRSLAGRDHYYATTYERMTTVAGEPFVVAVFMEVTEQKAAAAEIQSQLEELQRWHEAMINREDRVLELKREVNELLTAHNQPTRYPEITML